MRTVRAVDVLRRSALPAPEAWRRVTDWKRHEEFVPLTTMRITADPTTGRERVVARTAVGPLGFDDPMTVTYVKPPTETEPGTVRLVKTGRVVAGWTVITVTPSGGGSEVHWYEEARLRGTGGPIASLLSRAFTPVAARLLEGLLA